MLFLRGCYSELPEVSPNLDEPQCVLATITQQIPSKFFLRIRSESVSVEKQSLQLKARSSTFRNGETVVTEFRHERW